MPRHLSTAPTCAAFLASFYARVNLAESLRRLGRVHEALRLNEEILPVLTSIVADDDAGLQTLRQNLAIVLNSKGAIARCWISR